MGVLKVSYLEGDLETTLEKEYDSRPTFDEAFQFMHNVAKLNDFEEDEDVFDCDGNCDECEFKEDFDPNETVVNAEQIISNLAIEEYVLSVTKDIEGLLTSGEIFSMAKDESETLEGLVGYMEGYTQALEDMKVTLEIHADIMSEDFDDMDDVCPVCGNI